MKIVINDCKKLFTKVTFCDKKLSLQSMLIYKQ